MLPGRFLYLLEMRLFAALALPPMAIDRLSSVRLRLATQKDGLRWSAPEQWHITLRFFGDLDPAQANLLSSALATLAVNPIAMRLENFGTFAAKGILFLEVDASRELEALYARVQSIAASCGVLPESRPFHPHVTLARSRNRTGLASLRTLMTPSPPTFGAALHWTAKELLVLESLLQPEGAEYRTVAAIPLQTPA